ncbi:hypothetical protein RQP46_008704 [Phenoliferia psychrophenolica]
MLRQDARELAEACDTLTERLLNVYEKSYELRNSKEETIDVQMDVIFTKFVTQLQTPEGFGIKQASQMELVNRLTSDIESLDEALAAPALRRIAADVNDAGAKSVAAEVETTDHGTLPNTYKLQSIPLPFHLVGREDELERTLDQLTNGANGNPTGHVALVGLGGIGKTSVATTIAHDPRSKALGRPVFIRCEQLDTLDAFLLTLLRLRAPQSLQPEEILEEAVRMELGKEPLFLILDNLLDSTAASHDSYLAFIDSITTISTLTLLITSRNHLLANRSSLRPIHEINIAGLARGPAEELFREQYARVESDRGALEQDEPDMEDLLELLDGIPLAVVLVAAHARKAQSLADVIRRWEDRRAWHNGSHGRLTSLETSLEISFDDTSLADADAVNLLSVLADITWPSEARQDKGEIVR